MDGVFDGLSDRRRGNVEKIAAEMSPDPSMWKLVDITTDGGNCTCGQAILYNFILAHTDPKVTRRIVIGSSCIEDTVPWLQVMNAQGLVDAIRDKFKELLAEIRKQKTHVAGQIKLDQVLPHAVALDEWYYDLCGRVSNFERFRLHFMPTYFKSFKWIADSGGNTPGRRASSISKRISIVLAKAQSLRRALAKAGEVDAWIAPCRKVTVNDMWRVTYAAAQESRGNVALAFEADESWPTDVVRDYNIARATFARGHLVPFTQSRLERYITEAHELLALPTNEGWLDMQKVIRTAQGNVRTRLMKAHPEDFLQDLRRRVMNSIDRTPPMSVSACRTYLEELQSLQHELSDESLSAVRSHHKRITRLRGEALTLRRDLEHTIRRARRYQGDDTLYVEHHPLASRGVALNEEDIAEARASFEEAIAQLPNEEELSVMKAAYDANIERLKKLRVTVMEEQRQLSRTAHTHDVSKTMPAIMRKIRVPLSAYVPYPGWGGGEAGILKVQKQIREARELLPSTDEMKRLNEIRKKKLRLAELPSLISGSRARGQAQQAEVDEGRLVRLIMESELHRNQTQYIGRRHRRKYVLRHADVRSSVLNSTFWYRCERVMHENDNYKVILVSLFHFHDTLEDFEQNARDYEREALDLAEEVMQLEEAAPKPQTCAA